MTMELNLCIKYSRSGKCSVYAVQTKRFGKEMEHYYRPEYKNKTFQIQWQQLTSVELQA
jgi:hypothetical protein